MCILFIHVDPEPKPGDYRLVVATNRDEYYKRPALPASRDEKSNVIGGKDEEPGREGGMWLGFVTKKTEMGYKHCFAALTNITGEKTAEKAAGRGAIVKDYLESSKGFPEFAEQLEDGRNFGGYNLIAAELSSEGADIYHHGNKPVVDSHYSGKHMLGFGNSPTYVPLAKVSAGRYKFEEVLGRGLKGDELVRVLVELLKDRTKHLPDPELERRAPAGYEVLSSVYVELGNPGYGTRTHTVILIDHDWKLTFVEHTMKQPIDLQNPEWIVSEIELKL